MTFTPTQTESGFPAVCHVCGREATGIGLGVASRGSQDPRWICEECSALGRALPAAAKRLSVYEDRALNDAIERVGPLVETNGSDLAEWDEDQVREFCGRLIMEFGAAVREHIQKGEAPF